jgi:N-carbamoyl-L-amino-acid hydrolase
MNRRSFQLGLLAATGNLASRRVAHAAPGLRVNANRLNGHIAALAQFGRNPEGGVSRVAYSEADKQGRKYVMGLMQAARLDVSIDAAGNLVGRRAGRESGLAPLMLGSHIDSVPGGGNYDGDVGSLGAIEVAQILAENNVTTRHRLEIAIFQNEEQGLYGSKAISGEIAPKDLQLASPSGKTIGEGIQFIGGDLDKLATVRRGRGDVAAYLELHIEQGGILNTENVDIGVVEGIVGIRDWEVTVQGMANHAGTTPMNQRHDALLAAAQFIEAVNRVISSTRGGQVATIGTIQAFPGGTNVIPGKVVMSLEIRDLDASKITTLYGSVREEAGRIASASGTTFDFQQIGMDAPALTDVNIRQIIAESTKSLGLTFRSLPSGAGHDAESISRLAPIGMIFVPSVGGVSHSPKEFTRPEDVANGANVLLEALLRLDRAI